MERLIEHDGELSLQRRVYAQEDAEVIFAQLQKELAWQEEEIIVAGRTVKVPRLVCWYGEPGAVYRYSGVSHQPLAWTVTLLSIKRHVETCCGYVFNSVLANLYRDGRDSMGWHADKEPELGRNPVIASLSFGAERLFKISHVKSGETLDIILGQSDLLLMAGTLQHYWRHCVPKTRQTKTPRINLTFRKIFP
ncbi:MAG: alpha-ketoglutarate-dependent dioxygenase AlkB family protein [Gammaproteobacteria bacterium]